MKRPGKPNVWKIAVACRCAESDDDVRRRNGVSGETEAKERCGVDAGRSWVDALGFFPRISPHPPHQTNGSLSMAFELVWLIGWMHESITCNSQPV